MPDIKDRQDEELKERFQCARIEGALGLLEAIAGPMLAAGIAQSVVVNNAFILSDMFYDRVEDICRASDIDPEDITL